MDTSTHLIMGIGLFGLAHIDPTVMTHAETASAVLAATVVGSQLPDTDGLYRIKSTAAYIRNHRGWTHSLPMMITWPLLLTGLLATIFPDASKNHILLWSGIAVFVHIFIDLFNTYGTQALRPFSKEWISWDILNIFDPFISGIHLIGFLLWWTTTIHPGALFIGIYTLLTGYVLWRACVHRQLIQQIAHPIDVFRRLTITPTIRWNVWNVIAENESEVKIGTIRDSRLMWTDHLQVQSPHHPAIQLSTKTEAVDAFLSFTSYGYPQIYSRPFGSEVRWLDVRYHHKKHFLFVAVALLDHNNCTLHSFIGFMSKQKLEKKLHDLTKQTIGD